MRIRWALAAVGLVLSVVVPAQAAPPAAPCPVVADPAGDEKGLLASAGDSAGDLRSVTAGSVGGRVNAALTLTALDTSTPGLGHRYDVYVSDGERTVSLVATIDSGRGTYELQEFTTGSPDEGGAFASSGIGAIDGSFDTSRKRIQMSVETKRLGFGQRRRVTFSGWSWRIASTINTGPGVPLGYHQSEDSTAKATYRLGTSDCRLG